MNDILLNDKGDPIINNGDFATGDSLYQERKELMSSHTGDYKLVDVKGAGLRDYLQSNKTAMEIERKIKESYTSDGLKFDTIVVTQDQNGGIVVQDGKVTRS